MQTAINADINKISCPKCNDTTSLNISNETELHCLTCLEKYEIKNKIPILLSDTDLKTQLEDINYDSLHNINEQSCEFTFKKWKPILKEVCSPQMSLLEIGSGTGFLTSNLLKSNFFESIHATDLSYNFLKILESRIPEKQKERLKTYVCDANILPFKDDTFDIIAGNSVLHHLIDYKETIRKSYSILKKDGWAIFFEPVLEGKAIKAFLLDLFLKTDENFKLNIFTKEEKDKIQRQINHITNVPPLKNDRGFLSQSEDKYIFEISELIEVGFEIGFKNIQFINGGDFTQGFNSNGIAEEGFKSYVFSMLNELKIPVNKTNRLNFILESFNSTIEALLKENIINPMGFFLFQK